MFNSKDTLNELRRNSNLRKQKQKTRKFSILPVWGHMQGSYIYIYIPPEPTECNPGEFALRAACSSTFPGEIVHFAATVSRHVRDPH